MGSEEQQEAANGIVDSPELEQGVEGDQAKAAVKSNKRVSEDGGKTRVKKSA